MANIQGVSSKPGKGLHITTWTLAQGDVGLPVNEPAHADRSVHCYGTIGGATLTIDGSNEAVPTNWVTLTDTAAVALTITALPALKQVLQNALNIRPHAAGGDGTTAIVVILVSRSTRI